MTALEKYSQTSHDGTQTMYVHTQYLLNGAQIAGCSEISAASATYRHFCSGLARGTCAVLQIKRRNSSCISSFVIKSKGEEADTFLLFKGKRRLPSMCLFAQLFIVLSPIKHHQSLGTAGPATGRMINSLCQAPSQMVLTLSWRVWTLSIKHHLFKMLDEKP